MKTKPKDCHHNVRMTCILPMKTNYYRGTMNCSPTTSSRLFWNPKKVVHSLFVGKFDISIVSNLWGEGCHTQPLERGLMTVSTCPLSQWPTLYNSRADRFTLFPVNVLCSRTSPARAPVSLLCFHKVDHKGTRGEVSFGRESNRLGSVLQ